MYLQRFKAEVSWKPSPQNVQDTLVSGMSCSAKVLADIAMRQVCVRKILCNVLI